MDEKILCVPSRDPLYNDYRTLDDVASHFLLEVEHFFRVYKDLEGVRVQSLGWEDLDSARSSIIESMARYRLRRQQDESLRNAPTEPRAGREL
jgi:inorganic pyrophosphatase